MAVANSFTSRFGKASENYINDILQSKDSTNTKIATKVALPTLTAYIIEADCLHRCSKKGQYILQTFCT